MQTVDLRNLTCPEPVLRTKKLFDDPQLTAIQVLVDDEVTVRNLERLANYLNAAVTSTKTTDGFQVSLRRGDIDAKKASTRQTNLAKEVSSTEGNTTVVFLSKDTFGQGDEEFSRTLLNLFLQTLYETGQRPQAILLANSGVKLMGKDSSVLQVLKDFHSAGVEVAACGLCVNYYGLEADVPANQITNMFTICEYLAAASKVLTP